MTEIRVLAPGFQIVGGRIGPSHAHVHMVQMKCDVNVLGMLAGHDDVVHADVHGAVVIPGEAVRALPKAIDLMARREKVDELLVKVQERRMLPVKAIQALQRAIHKRVIGSALASRDPRAPWQLRLVDAVPLLQRVPARLLGLGIKREHIRSPEA